MTDEPIWKKRVVYAIAGMARTPVRKDLVYRTTAAGPLTLDLYAPQDQGHRPPVVVLVAGYNDAGFEKVFGNRFKETDMVVSWAQLLAASGLAAVTYTNREPAADLEAVLQHVGAHAESLGVDGERIGLWATSGNVPVALSALMHGPTRAAVSLRCAALLYGYMLDLDGATGVAEAAQAFRFTNPNAGKSLDDLPPELPLFVVRAGQEQFPQLNESIDGFFAKALADNRPITLVNHATGPHAFDLLDDSETSRQIITQTLDFLKASLT